MDKVMVGMSGGVDSSVSALLLKQQGYSVVGVTIKFIPDTMDTSSVDSAVADAKKVCDLIGIPHMVMDFSKEFEEHVIKYFIDEYENARTPNPCVMCNKHLKFGKFLSEAASLGAKYIATGHYAQVVFDDKTEEYKLKRLGHHKDQSYVLYNMTQHDLKHTLFPLASFSKDEVRKLAVENDLPVAHKSESQDICFVRDGDYAKFICQYTEKKFLPGDFIDKHGNILGQHNGIIHYTIGQRKGLGISLGKRTFVVDINAKENTVMLGENEDLFSTRLLVKDVNFISGDKHIEPRECEVKLRYAAPPSKAKITCVGENNVEVEFKEPQRAPTLGQAAVFYDGDFVFGGGIISRVLD